MSSPNAPAAATGADERAPRLPGPLMSDPEYRALLPIILRLASWRLADQAHPQVRHWGVPVLSARTSALPEVAGEAALYFDPLQPAELARAMEQVTADAECRKALIAKGRERLQAFSWEQTAAQTLAVYQDVLNGA